MMEKSSSVVRPAGLVGLVGAMRQRLTSAWMCVLARKRKTENEPGHVVFAARKKAGTVSLAATAY